MKKRDQFSYLRPWRVPHWPHCYALGMQARKRPTALLHSLNNGAVGEKWRLILKGRKAREDGKGNEANELLPLEFGHVRN